jgi:signal recognition particle receptor subunit alpha
LKKEDLAPVLEQFKELLIAKNVASECAEKLCTSVGSSLEGKTVSGVAMCC